MLNCGSDCKITPINDILHSMQSSIMKAQSPEIVGSKRFVSKAKFFRPGNAETEMSDGRDATLYRRPHRSITSNPACEENISQDAHTIYE